MADMTNLVRAYFALRAGGMTNRVSLEDLTNYLWNTKTPLRSPIPRDPTKPCYRLNAESPDRQPWILIEEVNVMDTQTRFVAYIDGSVAMVNDTTN